MPLTFNRITNTALISKANLSDLISAVNTYPTVGANTDHWFGVEPRTGRDLFAVWAYGARPSLVIGFVAAILSTILGVTLGLLAGYLGGRADKSIGWVIDLLLSLPLLLVVLAVVPVIQQRFTPAGQFLTAEEKSGIRFWVLIAMAAFELAAFARGRGEPGTVVAMEARLCGFVLAIVLMVVIPILSGSSARLF
jgi:ABC-type dipeptide/oligopeptide/nickel transport system permease subunit